MGDFEKYIGAKYPNRSPKILFQKFKDIDGYLFYGIKEIEDQAEVWNHQQAIIDDLKAQLECCRKENAVLLGKVGEGEKRIDEALQEVKGLERFACEDCIADFEVLQGAVSHAGKRLEKVLQVPVRAKL